MEKNWYYCSYNALDKEGNVDKDVCVDGEYFSAENDDAAVEYAKELASIGAEYVDIGHVDLELVSVCRVDPDNEYEEVETIWF